MKLKFLAPALLAGLVAFTSCSKDDSKKEEPKKENNQGGGNQQGGNQKGGNQQGEQKPATDKITLDFSGNEVKEVQLNALTGWKYFSLKEGKEVTPAKPEEDLTWDIAFNSYYVRLNGGTSGKGKAEAVKVEGTNFAEIVEAPKAGFAKDAQGKISQGNYPNITKVDASFSQYMSGGLGTKTGIIGLNPLKAPNVFFPTNYIYIVKAADGTYAKIQVTDFYKEIAGQKVPNFPKLKYQLSKTVSQ